MFVSLVMWQGTCRQQQGQFGKCFMYFYCPECHIRDGVCSMQYLMQAWRLQIPSGC